MVASHWAEAIVVGLGAMGSATCRQLAARGHSVIGIDQFSPPHPYGSTHGETRITRLAVGEGPEYVPLVRRSHELWRELEELTGTRLLTQPGGLVLARPASPFFAETCKVARRFGIEHERLTNAEVRERFPMFAVDDRTEAYYEPASGYLRPEAIVAAQLDLARRHGARLRLRERVLTWSASAQGVTVTTAEDTYAGDQLVFCAGPWLPQLFPEGDGIFAIHRQLQYWFPILEGYEQLRDMPIFVWDFGGEQPDIVHLHGFYGFPAIDGPAGGLKLAAEAYDETTTPDGHQHAPTRDEVSDMYRDYVHARMPCLGSEPVRTISCLYTSTRGSRFVIDRHPSHDEVLIVSACSGHGFKHSAAIGEAVAQWVTGETAMDLSAFRLA
jgi:sarcosine oxidase